MNRIICCVRGHTVFSFLTSLVVSNRKGGFEFIRGFLGWKNGEFGICAFGGLGRKGKGFSAE